MPWSQSINRSQADTCLRHVQQLAACQSGRPCSNMLPYHQRGDDHTLYPSHSCYCLLCLLRLSTRAALYRLRLLLAVLLAVLLLLRCNALCYRLTSHQRPPQTAMITQTHMHHVAQQRGLSLAGASCAHNIRVYPQVYATVAAF